MKKQEFEDGRMNTAAAAAYIGISTGTLENKRVNGTGPPFVKRGRVWYFKVDIDTWLQEGKYIRWWLRE